MFDSTYIKRTKKSRIKNVKAIKVPVLQINNENAIKYYKFTMSMQSSTTSHISHSYGRLCSGKQSKAIHTHHHGRRSHSRIHPTFRSLRYMEPTRLPYDKEIKMNYNIVMLFLPNDIHVLFCLYIYALVDIQLEISP